MKNINLVKTVFQIIKKIDVEDIIICAGARNLPFVSALEFETFNVTSYFEERSAAFYALGKSKSTQRPVAIITTSGTAVAELLPAVVEAYYQNIPLILITADRPKKYRGTGSPQSIEQKNIFQNYVENCFDWDIEQPDLESELFVLNYSLAKPIHFNICFDEPLTDGSYSDALFSNIKLNQVENKLYLENLDSKILVNRISNPLAIISDLNINDRNEVILFIKNNNIFHVAEFLSGLQNHPELKDLQINHLDGLAALLADCKFESVIRIGGIPTHRFWRDLENKYIQFKVYNFSHREFKGLVRPSVMNKISDLQTVEINYSFDFQSQIFLNKNNKLLAIKNDLLEKYNLSEPAFISILSQIIQNEPLYIGNSLPIREWDLFSNAKQQMGQKVFAHRGANGIDGQISSYLGWSESFLISWCLIGDLTALYDLAGLGMCQLNNKKRIVIMNNSGGQIFNRLFGHKKYLNSQQVDFLGWAKLWHWDYVKIQQVQDFKKIENHQSDKLVIEIIPDNQQSDSFWNEWDQVCKKKK